MSSCHFCESGGKHLHHADGYKEDSQKIWVCAKHYKDIHSSYNPERTDFPKEVWEEWHGKLDNIEIIDNNPRVCRSEESEDRLSHISTDTGVPKYRLRGMAIEYAVQADSFEDFVDAQEENDE